MNKIATTLFFFSLCISVQAQKHYEYVNHLSDYIQYPSITGNERQAGLYLLNLAKEKGLHTKILTDSDSAFNFIASLYPISQNKPNYVFLNHIDVVDTGDPKKWKYPPFSGIVEDSIIWGRGAIDNKGMAMAQFAALAEFGRLYKGSHLPFNITLLAVSGEETGSIGGKIVAREWLDSLNIIFMLGEGGSGVTNIIPSYPDKPVFGISTSEKTRIVLGLELRLYTSGHASVPPDEYALKEMIQALSRVVSDERQLIFNKINSKSLRQLGKMEGGIKGFILRYHRFPLFRPLVKAQIKKDPMMASFFSNTIAITDFSNVASEDNQFPGIISVTLDCRLLPDADLGKFLNTVRRKLRDDRITIKIKEAVISPGRTYNKHLFYIISKAIQEVYPGSDNIEIIFPATSDNSIFRSNGITVFGLFPGIFSQEALENVHSIDEYIKTEVFLDAIDVYYKFLTKLAEMDVKEMEVSLIKPSTE